MKTISRLLLLFMLLLPQWASAQEAYKCVVVETMDGERMEYLLSDNPRIVHHDGLVTLATNSVNVDFPTSNVLKVYLSDTATRISHAKKAEGEICLQENAVLLKEFSANESVHFYSSDGRLLWKQVTDSNGRLTVSLSSLQQGIYILKTNHQTLKISRK